VYLTRAGLKRQTRQGLASVAALVAEQRQVHDARSSITEVVCLFLFPKGNLSFCYLLVDQLNVCSSGDIETTNRLLAGLSAEVTMREHYALRNNMR